ncbi:Asp-tRNA(Asn)/Glu-tRNA(Gln) amidotransferase subunit GatB [Alkalibacter rhizosphaerae]|uniref:Aspartyl/glutamyl-tRNA(Asn/Gln) amidotransferase subunit B n=1 Tax=Alkalibacter rhizosphaerae TaxID=2815577 RepID=A0A975AHI9_9FIRM|nr:Asp-tRNA(Asn)/Glu-tRNA(Gln) amidotransferase subunit GatB [Alkalibacter rhizosphaerae]QSX08063.1 Asp-tRNA(Asn)/Glu-tRNA(Gln) amidotransferase subunit GatB [Alkalibacter rhizosphaerae]
MEYEIVIGLEIHSELDTKSKIFCGCSTAFGGEENTQTCPVCLGLPGVLPVMNKKVVEYAVKAGIATNCTIARFSKMDRKNYFYPDLPKAYQISQFDLPICEHGTVEINVDGVKKNIGITRIHMEEDAGKLIHAAGGTLADNNRCGVPLIEIVTEPDMRSAAEARALAEKIKTILEYTEVSDCKMQEGSLRFDVNLSVRKPGEPFGTRTEMKNLNSFRALERAVEVESKRQIFEIERGNPIIQQTRKWDDDKGESYALRSKEEAHDYRYFPDPDLVPVVLTEEYIQNIKGSMPILPWVRKVRYMEDYNLSEYDADILVSSRETAEFFEGTVAVCKDAKTAANWLMGDIAATLNEKGQTMADVTFTPAQLGEMIGLINDKTISSSIAKQVLQEMFATGKDPKVIVEEKNLAQMSDTSELKGMVLDVMKANPQSVEDLKNGKEKAIGFLVGQIMRQTKGKANPQMVNELIRELIDQV